MLDEKDEGVKIGIVRVNSDYTSHNTLIGELIIVKAERKGKNLLLLKSKRFHCGQIMNSAV